MGQGGGGGGVGGGGFAVVTNLKPQIANGTYIQARVQPEGQLT